nr:serine-rich adhesin for platelets-like isoform X7 [Procambarus clarkii]
MLHCTTLSVQGGGGSKGVGGGVMEDGAALASVAARVSSSAPRKANSLPGYYSRGSSHQPSFREAFNTSKSPTPPVRHDAAPAAPPRGPTSPRATRVSALMPSVTLQQRQLQQQRSIQQQQQQQQQQQLQQQQLQKQQLQKQQQQHLQQQQQQQLQQQQLHQPHYQELQKQQQQLQQNQQQRAQQQQKNQQQQRLLQQQQHEQQQKQKQQLVQQTQRDQKQQRQQRQQEPTPGKPTPQLEKKKRSLLSGIFRRRKKEVSSSSSSNTSNSDSEEPPQRRTFLRRRTKKKEAKEKEPSLPPATADAPTLGNARVTADDFPGQSIEPRTQEINTMLLAENNSRRVRVATTTTGSLGRDTQPLGIPLLMPQPGKLSKIGVSASHDSLPVSLGSWGGGGSHASLGYYSGGGMGTRSSSTDTISKKERREALKARVERLRDKFKDTSSDEEKASVSSHSMYGSEYSLSKTNSLSRRTRAARTERFLRRKSQELETLRNETEKDRRNREVVQARIEEIQRVREFEAERNKINAEKQQIPDKSKPKWSAKLVYQESSEYESSVLLRTPSVSPAASPHMKAKFQGHIPPNTTNAKEAVTMRQKPQTPHMSVTVSLAPPSGTQMRRSFQDFETPFQNDLRGHRSASYDSNINRNSFLMQPPSGFNCSGAQTANVIPQSRSGQIPPAPPPRDRSRIMSPGDGRPMSFSFENLNHETQRPNSSQSSMSNFTKGSSPSPSIRSVPAYLGPRPSNQLIGQPPPMVPNRRSFSELELSPQQQIQTKSNSGAPPSRPAPPMYPSTQYRYTDQPPKSFQQNQCCRVQQQQQQQQPLQHTQNQTSNPQLFYTDQAPQYAKIVPISSVPPSPSSDYSSYMSDNSVRLQQANTIWRQREQEIKNKITAMQSVTSQVLSDSSRSNSPKLDGYCSNGVASSPVTQHTDDTYGIIESKKPRPPPLTLKQAESLSSLSGQSDVSSPVPKAPDSDSSQSSLAREKKKLIQNRPLSMVLEKSESGEKDSPPNTPKSRPQPPRRGSKQLTTPGREITKRQMLQEIMKHKLEHPQEKTYQKEFEEMYRKEKERLERSKCSNFEEALKELEEIYASLKLDSEDLLDRAERRDLPVQHQKLKEDGQDMHDSISETGEADSTAHGRGRSRTPKLRRAGVPDVKADDMHYRRCQQSTRNQPDVQKALQMTGSYLLVSAVHVPPTDIDKNVPKDPMLEGQPDIVYDDVSYRNIKQANSIKVIDPQPPFGIPLGPTTQGSPSDYLHVTPKENYRPKMIARKEPDITMDDLAFRNLRKEQRDQSNKEVNVAELDELLSEANNESPVYRRKTVRSASADRAHSLRGDTSDSASNNINDRRLKLQTPRRVKHQNEARRSGRFFGNDAVGDSETTKTTNAHSPRHNPSWLERAHLLDNKWDNLSTNNLSTSTETLTELSSVRAVSQPDIRQAIIREARIPPGGPQNIGFGPQTVTVTALTTATTASVTIATITAPKIVTVQTIQSAPVSPVVVERKPPYRPLDTIFNNKAKPFYLADAKPQTQHHQDHVDIAKLDALISTLSKIDNNEDMSDASSVTSKNTDEPPVTDFDTQELKIKEEPTYENVFEPQTIVSQSTASHSIQNEKTSAKVNIGKAIRLSMALESYSSEGERDDHLDHDASPHRTGKGRSPLKEAQKGSDGERPKERQRRSESERHKPKDRPKERQKERPSEAEKLKERERKDKKLEYDRLKIGDRERQRAAKAQGSEEKERRRKSQEREKRKSLEDRERRRKSEERERRKSVERERKKSIEREKRRSEERDNRRHPEKQRQGEEREKRREKQRPENADDGRPGSPEKTISSSSSSNSSSSRRRMVQQKSSGAGAGGGSRTDLPEAEQAERAEQERRERIQRYKDERRKQIAARYGTAEWSSSEESGGAGEESSYLAYRRRRRRGRDVDTSSTELSPLDATSRVQENGSSLEGRGRRAVGGSSSEDVVMGVRSTRTSRLRHAALSSSSNNNNNNNNLINNNSSSAQDVARDPATPAHEKAAASPDQACHKRVPDQGVGGDSADSTLSGSDGRGGRRRRQSVEDRDKSHKRKSNLNRSANSEEPAADVFASLRPTDANEETPRRRRRRGPPSPVSASLSGAGAEPLKTPEVVCHVVSRLGPPSSPPTHPPAQPSPPPTRRHPSPQPTLPAHTFQPIQPALPQDTTHSAPSTLDSRSRFAPDGETRRVSSALGERSETEEGFVRKVPPKLAPLRKPEIPDVLRPKDTTGLASPGVVNTPPNSRPSSVVLEKPPLAPEGQRPAAVRSSLRKPSDTGTCFMAARREKRDETKPENIFRELQQRPRKGDRLSKSDMNLKIESSYSGKQSDSLSPGGSDLDASGAISSPTMPTNGDTVNSELMSSRLEALTARARETIERVDRLANDSPPPLPETSPPEDSADNVVHECEEYLTVNASRKESTVGVRPRETSAADSRGDRLQAPAVMKGVVSDTGQKNWVGGSEGRGKESKRVAMEKEMNRDNKRDSSQVAVQEKVTAASAVPSGPPDHGALINDNIKPPPEEVVHGLQHEGYDDEDLGSPDSSQIRSPDHRSNKRSSRRCSLDGDTSRTNSPDPHSILKRRSSREDVANDRPTTPEPHSILKRKTSSRASSIDTIEGEPRPILKKKSSIEELDHFEPRPILKKKSSTDDELDDRPRSILKGGRSREDLDRVDCVTILKRSPRCDSEGEGELRPILKRRETTDGVRLRLHVSDGEDVESEAPSVRMRSDSAPEAVIRIRGRSPPAPSATPSHGILKKRGAQSPGRFDQMDSELGAILRSRRSQGPEDNDKENDMTNRPVSPSLVALIRREDSASRSGERPLSVAERVAGMEAGRQEPPPVQHSPTPSRSPGARPKVTPSFFERPQTPTDRERENRRNSAFGLVADPSPVDSIEAINEAFLDRPVVEAYNSAMSSGCDTTPDTPSSVSQRAAFFAQLEREQTSSDGTPVVSSRSTRFSSRRDRGTRFEKIANFFEMHATQPVTDDEVSQAARLADASDSASASHDSDSAPPRRGSLPWKSGTQGDSSSSHHSKHKNGSSNSVGARVALWTKRLEEERLSAPTLDGAQAIRRRSRSARFKTQPVTLEEVAHAHAFNSQNVSTTTGTPEEQELASGFRAARDAVLRNAGEVMQGLTPGSSPRRRPTSRKTSLNEPDEEYSSDPVRGILKRDGSGGSREAQRDSPRSILKHSSSDSRRASFSESEHPRGILKSDSPLPPSIGSPEHEAKLLRGVLKKDSSLEDSKEIKSILKPESESLEPDHSSDSSSDDVTLTTANTPQGPECDIAESIRDIDPIRHKDDSHKSDTPHKVDPYKTEHHRADLAEALRQVEPIKSKDDLAEALRQIEPIHSKERSREKEDKGKDETQTIGVREFSSSTKATSSMTTMVTMAATVSSSSAATTNSSSSTSESEHKTIKNETVVRRRNTHSRRYDERRSMVELRDLDQQEAPEDAVEVSRHDTSESSSSSDSADGLVRTSRTVHTRSCVTLEMDASQILQQSPIFKDKSSTSSSSSPEQSRSERGTTGGSSSPSVSINARLAALQRSGEDGWKNRVKKEGKDVNSNVTLRPKPVGGLRERPVSLMDRMSALETSSQQWRGRITQSDATKFTVAHKMASSSTSSVPSIVGGNSPLIIVTPEQPSTPIGSPLLERKKRSPCQKVFKSKTGGNLPALLNKSSPLSSRKDFRRSISTPNDGEKRAEILEGTSVSVPRADDESFTSFFSRTTSTEPSLFPDVDVPILEDADFDLISETASQLVVKRRSVRVTRRQVASRNPLKTLAAREDLKSEYTEVKMGVGERELRRMKVQELSKGSPMAVEALAGLASRENFSAVALKKVESTPVIREMAPYTSLMLLQIKGRRHAQTRLVEPIASSINQGDDFVLITPTDVYHYKGEFSNVIERAKAAEIAQYILQKKDMGVTSAKNLVEMDENSPSGRKSKFWKLLGGDETSEGQPGGLPDEDEYVEAALVAVNKVYEVQDDSLVPLADSWGQMPKIEILVSDKVLVFDFGSELYIWAGKRACSDKRKVGLALGRELWEEQYDYSECDINPIVPMTPVSKAKMKGSRPEWGMCAKLTENVETILFKEKFIDWPDLAQQSRIKEVKKELDRHVAPVCELQPCDAKMMLEELPLEPDLVLEMSHLGRGVEYYDEEERRLLSISTNDFKVWHVSEYGKVLMDATSHSHLHAGDTYVVRWYYLITATGRTLKGEPSKHNVTGRSRVAYFFWQGRESSVSDKGVSALMTVELDEERGPHVRVSMGMEPPAFLNLFQGGLVIHQGHKDDDHANKQWKLFVVRGEMENEGHLVELEVSSTHLRSRGCLILANMQTGVIHLWHGAKALKHTRKVGSTAAQKLSETSDIAMGWKKDVAKKIKEQYEGAESREFWEGFGGSSSKNKHFSLLEDDHSYDWTPRVWQLEPTHDSFQATEVICSYRATSLPNPLPVLQLDLYSVPQPALFLVDACHRVWVWQGWWPDETSEGEDFSATGSAVLRFNFARRAALETALSYCKLKAKAQAKAIAAKSYKKVEVDVDVVEPQLVVAGLEPLQFTNIFPTWTPRPDVTAIQEKEGRWKQDGQYLVSDILAQLSRTEYSFAELIVKPLPDGVDPLHLEVYLGEEEFTQVLGMGREEFYSLQSWKQTELKKKAKLF